MNSFIVRDYCCILQAGVTITVITYIREVLGSKLGREKGYSGWGLSLLSQSLQANAALFQVLSNSQNIAT
jgi:hypothetical protein